MKRKELLAKSLAVGLAVAMAASSMSTPGGLLAPIEVMAEEKPISADDFEITAGDQILIAGDEGVSATVTAKDTITGYDVSKLTLSYKKAGTDEDVEAVDGKLTESGKYDVYITADAVSDSYGVIADPAKVGTVTVYGKLTAAVAELSYTVASTDDEEVEFTPGTDKAKSDVTVKAGGNPLKVVDALPEYDETMTETSAAITAPVEDGAVEKYVLVKKDGQVYASNKITVDFDVTAPVLAVPVVKDITHNSVKIEVKLTDDSKANETGHTLAYALIQSASMGSATQETGRLTDGAAEISLTGLESGKEYTGYKVIVTDEANNSVEAAVPTFTTKAFQGTLIIKKSGTKVDDGYQPTEGETLTAEIDGGDGTKTPSYVWKKGDAEIDGATSAEYTVKAADVGATLTVVATVDGKTQELTTGVVKADERKTPDTSNFSFKKTVLMTTEVAGNIAGELDGKAITLTTVEYKKADAEDSTYTTTAPTESGAYNVRVSGDATSDYKAFSDVVLNGTISVYKELASEATFTYNTDKSDTDKFNTDVTVESSGNQVQVIDAVELPAFSSVALKDTDTVLKPSADGDKTVWILVSASGQIYAKQVTLHFDATKPTVNVSVDTTDVQAVMTVDANDNMTAKNSLTYTLTVTKDGATDPVAGTTVGADGICTISGLDRGATYNYTLTVSDEAGNETIYTDSFTMSENAALTGTLSITGATGAPKPGDTLSADIADGDGNASYTYQWYRKTSSGAPVEIDGATAQTYEVTAGDVGCMLSVTVSAEDNGETKSLSKSTLTVVKKNGKDLTGLTFAFDEETRVLTLTLPGGVDAAELEYTKDNGTTWMPLAGTTIQIDSAAYGAGVIQVRAKETDEANAGTAVPYNAAIAAASGGDTPDTPSNPGNTGGSGSSGGSSGGSSSSGTSTPSTETKPDGTTVTTTEEKKPDGTTVTTTEEKKPDGSTTTTTEEKKPDGTTVTTTEAKKADGSTVTAVEEKKTDGTSVTTTKEQNKDGSTKTAVEEKKADGSATTKTEEKKADGTTLTGVEEKKTDGSATAKVSLENKDAGVQATVDVAKDTKGKVTDATAQVTQVVPDKTPVVSATTVNQITAAAGTKDVVVTQKVVDADGKTICNVTVNLSDLEVGNDMKVLKLNKKTGEKSLINKSVYTVDEDGSVVLADLKKANYVLVTAEEEAAFSKKVVSTIKVKQSKKSLKAGKKTKIALSDKLNKDNVAKITYTTSKKSVATVNKNGTISAKKAGKVTIKAKVTLKNGKTKTVKMTVTVKPKKNK